MIKKQNMDIYVMYSVYFGLFLHVYNINLIYLWNSYAKSANIS